MPLPSWVSPDETKPAPMPLLLVQAFVNTWDADHASDLLLEPGIARDWLAAAGLWADAEPPGPAELQLARAVREAIRALIGANDGGVTGGAESLRPLQDLADACPVRIEVGPDGTVGIVAEEPRPSGAAGAGGRLGARLIRLLLVIRDAQQDGTWARLKTCHNSDCRWAFYDRSHSRAGAWCDMTICGNRIKNRRLRERQR